LLHNRYSLELSTVNHYPLTYATNTLQVMKHVLFQLQFRNSRIHPMSTVASKFARFESSPLQGVRTIAREGVQNTHH